MERMTSLLQDPTAPPSAEVRDQMLHALQSIQAAMERLQAANGMGPATPGSVAEKS